MKMVIRVFVLIGIGKCTGGAHTSAGRDWEETETLGDEETLGGTQEVSKAGKYFQWL